MMRLPPFRYCAPTSIQEAVELLAANPHAMIVGGGTDLFPNMKRRQQIPPLLIGTRKIEELHGVRQSDGLTIGAGTTLANLLRNPVVSSRYRGLWQAAAQVATPLLRNMGTIGGNLCLDTRCNYYDQSFEWRQAIGFCLKKDGDICWVAPSSRRCLAVSSTDLAPMLAALGATVSLTRAGGTRELAVSALYQNDGIAYSRRQPDELLTAVHIPSAAGWRSTYWKLRRRGSFDFPVLSVACAIALVDGIVTDARIVLGAVSSWPLIVPDGGGLGGQRLTDTAIGQAAELAATLARPMDNTDFSLLWRKRVCAQLVICALRELRGDDVSAVRRRIARQELTPGAF